MRYLLQIQRTQWSEITSCYKSLEARTLYISIYGLSIVCRSLLVKQDCKICAILFFIRFCIQNFKIPLLLVSSIYISRYLFFNTSTVSSSPYAICSNTFRSFCIFCFANFYVYICTCILPTLYFSFFFLSFYLVFFFFPYCRIFNNWKLKARNFLVVMIFRSTFM